ncbi:hypothetical protein SAMN02745127_00710 [Oceanospirillum multiglobuliferum]|uniref:Uncharacterized protein n=1 Tax=Oceanospirillum multiglobuliferum TaxID=64969 RepID=A0A1T4M8P5_9GAMM|nr:hypothetical protein BTE48_04275 [Oceanospirillum multiglobuliferum]SJZ63410.1 hypothetical protein SAMN02745127_00710 [Oceanospirillum multiglobuliferum]
MLFLLEMPLKGSTMMCLTFLHIDLVQKTINIASPFCNLLTKSGLIFEYKVMGMLYRPQLDDIVPLF